MEMLGLDIVGADETKKDATKEWFKKAGAAIIPAAASAAEGALTDKPKDAPKPGDPKDGSKPQEEGFFSRVIVSPVRVWHALLGVVAAGGGIYLWKRK